MSTSTNPRIKKIPPMIPTLMRKIISKQCDDVIEDMDQVNKLLKEHNLTINDTEIDVIDYNNACREMIAEKASDILDQVLLFQNSANDFENKAIVFKNLLSRAKISIMSLDIDIDNNDELEEICRLYHRDYAIFIAKHFIRYQSSINSLLELPVDDSKFSKPIAFSENLEKRIEMYKKAVELSGLKEKYFPFTVQPGPKSIHTALKHINISIMQLYIKLISNNKLVLSNFFHYCERKQKYNINPVSDMGYTLEEKNCILLKPVSQTLNSAYDNLIRAPQLIDDIKKVVEMLSKGYFLVKRESSLGLCYDQNNLTDDKVSKLHLIKAKYLFEELKKYGRRSDFENFERALSRSQKTYANLNLSRDKVIKLVKKDIRLV